MRIINSIGRGFFYLFVAFLPFQINALLFSETLFFSGFFNPYLSHFVYLSDLFFILSVLFLSPLFFRRFNVGDKCVFYGLIAVFSSFFVSLFFSVDVLNSLAYLFRFGQIFLVYLVIVNSLVAVRGLIYVFLAVMFFESLIGVGQYILQESLGLRFFGEPVISSAHLGVAKVGLFDKNVLRIYGTFPHPNIFAGYLLVAVFLCLNFVRRNILFKVVLFTLLLALLLTFSRSALLAFVLGLFLIAVFYKGKVSFKPFFILFFLSGVLVWALDLWRVILERLVIADFSLFERLLYYEISLEMFAEKWFGVGAGNFTAVMQDFTNFKLPPWLYQPVHNIYFLLANEIGLQGLFAFLVLLFFVFKNLFYSFKKRTLNLEKNFVITLAAIFLSFAVIGVFDHYLVSLYQGQMLFAVVLGFVGRAFKRKLI